MNISEKGELRVYKHFFKYIVRCYLVYRIIIPRCWIINMKTKYIWSSNHISGVMVSVFSLSAVDHEFEPLSSQTKDYEICICCFSAKHAALRRKSKDWLCRNQDNVFGWDVQGSPQGNLTSPSVNMREKWRHERETSNSFIETCFRKNVLFLHTAKRNKSTFISLWSRVRAISANIGREFRPLRLAWWALMSTCWLLFQWASTIKIKLMRVNIAEKLLSWH